MNPLGLALHLRCDHLFSLVRTLSCCLAIAFPLFCPLLSSPKQKLSLRVTGLKTQLISPTRISVNFSQVEEERTKTSLKRFITFISELVSDVWKRHFSRMQVGICLQESWILACLFVTSPTFVVNSSRRRQ